MHAEFAQGHAGGRLSVVRTLPALAFALSLSLSLALALESSSFAHEYHLRFSADIHSAPYSGRVYLFFGNPDREPRTGLDWFHPEPFCGLDVVDWQPGQTLVISPQTPGLRSFPRPLAELELTGKTVQAIARFNPWDRKIGSGAGNGFSAAMPVTSDATQMLEISSRVAPIEFRVSNDRRLLRVRSQLLSDFQHREVQLQAGVLLPLDYDQHPERTYPVIFDIPGFGGTHFDIARWRHSEARAADGTEFIVVVPDPSCPLGHSAFADSANNGPWGTALVRELIPALNREFRVDKRPEGRFLTGHSSGGWSSLWLQVMYRGEFNGTWSTAPDPVTFRDFQQIDLTADANMFHDGNGNRRPLAIRDGQPVLWFDDFCHMEDVLGYGGQLHSFEAVFSKAGDQRPGPLETTRMNAPPAPHPIPRTLWNRETGEIDRVVAATWEHYDIMRQLQQHWPEWQVQLQGKLHVYMGEQDTFYLTGATRQLREAMQQLESDAEIEIVPDRNHFDLLSPHLRQQCLNQMAARWRRSLE